MQLRKIGCAGSAREIYYLNCSFAQNLIGSVSNQMRYLACPKRAAIRDSGCCRLTGTYAPPAIIAASAPIIWRGPRSTITAIKAPRPTPEFTKAEAMVVACSSKSW